MPYLPLNQTTILSHYTNMENKKTWLLTVALNFTYEMEIECDENTANWIAKYPRGEQLLPPEIRKKIEQAGDYGKLVDDFAEVVEIEECDLMEV